MTDATEHPHTSLSSHLAELRAMVLGLCISLLVSFVFCYYHANHIYYFLLRPLAHLYGPAQEHVMIYTGLTEAFFTYLRLAFYAALFITLPIFMIQLYIFIAPGLYAHEKKVIIPYLIATPLLFWLGATFVYYFIFPTAWQYFTSFEVIDSDIPIQLYPRVSEYLSLVIHLIFAFGLAFQLPVIITLLVRANILNVEDLAKKRKFIIVIIFALPMILLYELSLLVCKYIQKRKD
jgi:sec-independent protein translocase protein TatC